MHIEGIVNHVLNSLSIAKTIRQLSNVQKITSAILLQILSYIAVFVKRKTKSTAEAARAEAKPLLSAVAESGLCRVAPEEDEVNRTNAEIEAKR